MTLLAQRIKLLRTSADISQEQMAGLLGMSRLTYASMESGKREPKPSELEKIATIFETSVTELLGEKAEELPQIPATSSHSKMMHIILYILSKCAGKPNVGKIVINKLLYFADFDYYEKYFESISGEEYIKMPMGPVPKEIDIILSAMQHTGLIEELKSTFFGYEQKRYIPLVSPDLSQFNGNELFEINNVISKYSDKTGKWLTEYSHDDMPRKATKELGGVIAYGLVHYRSPLYAVTEQSPTESSDEKEARYKHSLETAFGDLSNESTVYESKP